MEIDITPKVLASLKSKLIAGEIKFSQKRKKSRVWEVFAMLEHSNGQEIRNVVGCRKCFNLYKFKNSTSNLARHKCYFLAFANAKDEADVDMETKKRCIKAIAEWCVFNCRPFDISNDDGFKKIATFFLSVGASIGANVDVETLLPNSTTISRNINKMYEYHFNELKSEILKVRSNSYGLTTDVWTDEYIHSSFLSITIHYIFEGEMVSRLLAIKLLKVDECNDKHIKKKFLNVLEEFGCEIEEDEPVIVSRLLGTKEQTKGGLCKDINIMTKGDEAINIKKKLTKVLEEYGCEILEDDPIAVSDTNDSYICAFNSKNNICCIDYLLNNTIEKTISSLPQLAKLVSYCSKLVKYLKKSGIDSAVKASLKSMHPTRCSTVVQLLKSVEENWSEITKILRTENEHQRIQNINLHELSSITKLLAYFENASKMLEADKYPTLHLVIPHVYRLKKVCAVNQEDTEIVKNIKTHLFELLQNLICENLTIFHKVALFLFPPTNKLIQFTSVEKEEIVKECQKITVALSKTSFVSNQTNLEQERGICEIFPDFVEMNRPDSLDDRVINEINTYKSINIAIANNFDVIHWWNEHKSQFPYLYRTSCKILATPASSAASVRAFSAARQHISQRDYDILKNFDLVNKIMFLYSNVKEIHKWYIIE